MVNPPPWVEGGKGRLVNVVREMDCNARQIGYTVQPSLLVHTAAVLGDMGVEVSILDANASRWSYPELQPLLEKTDYDLILFLANLDTLQYDAHTATLAKKANPSRPTIALGALLAPASETVYRRCPSVDGLVYGEPEVVLPNLAQNLSCGGVEEAFGETEGLMYRGGGGEGFVKNPPSPLLEDLDRLPVGAWHLLPMERYSLVYQKAHPLAALRTSRGCPYHCNFCLVGGWTPDFRGGGFGWGRWRSFSAPRVLREIDHLVERFGVKEIVFLDDAFTIDRRRVVEICKGLEERGRPVVWRCLSRVDKVDGELLRTMARAGCHNICFGCESADQAILDRAGKGISPRIIEKAVDLCLRVGIAPTTFWMLGLPGETWETALKTIRFASGLGAMGYEWTLSTPYPGTVLHQTCVEGGYLRVGGLEDYDQTHPTLEYSHLSSADLKRLHLYALTRTTLSPTYLVKRSAWAVKETFKMRSLGGVKGLVRAGLSFAKEYSRGARFIR